MSKTGNRDFDEHAQRVQRERIRQQVIDTILSRQPDGEISDTELGVHMRFKYFTDKNEIKCFTKVIGPQSSGTRAGTWVWVKDGVVQGMVLRETIQEYLDARFGSSGLFGSEEAKKMIVKTIGITCCVALGISHKNFGMEQVNLDVIPGVCQNMKMMGDEYYTKFIQMVQEVTIGDHFQYKFVDSF